MIHLVTGLETLIHLAIGLETINNDTNKGKYWGKKLKKEYCFPLLYAMKFENTEDDKSQFHYHETFI